MNLQLYIARRHESESETTRIRKNLFQQEKNVLLIFNKILINLNFFILFRRLVVDHLQNFFWLGSKMRKITEEQRHTKTGLNNSST